MPFAGITPKMLQNAYPGLSSQDDPNNPKNAFMNFVPQPTPQQPAESQPQAMQGSSENANLSPEAPGSVPMDASQAYYQAMLAQNAMDPEMQKRAQENIDAQQKGLGELQGYQDQIKKFGGQTDYSPLMALADSLTGSQLQKGYKAPQTNQENIGELAKLQNMTQEQRNKITQDLTKLAIGKNSQGALRAMGQQANLDFRQKSTAQKQYDTQVAPVRLALEASDRYNKLLTAAQNGKLVPTSQLLRQLSEDQSKLVSGKANYGEGTAEALNSNAYINNLENLKQKISAMPQGYLDPKMASQMKEEAKTLSGGYMDQADRTAQTLLSGATPTQAQVISQRHGGLKKQYEKSFGYWGSPQEYEDTATNPTTGEKVGLLNGKWVPIGR